MSLQSANTYRARNLEKVRAKDRARGKIRWQTQREKMYETRRNSNRKLRREVIKEYGGKCACCGEDQHEFLAIDHVHNDGAKERREVNKRSADWHRWLRDQGYPKGRYQVLCHNCNLAKAFYGVCPHQQRIGACG